MQDLKYQIFDTECLKGSYFSYQWRNENMEKTKMIECTSDADCYRFYSNLQKANRSMYCYSINYDKTMLNALCKFVEKDIKDISTKLRRVNDYIILGNLNYFRLNREFWCNNYFKMIDSFDNKAELFKLCIDRVSNTGDKYVESFLEEFPYLLGQSKVFKNLNIIDVPKMLYYFSIRKDGQIRPTISLKDIQLYEEGYNITHDFNELYDIDEIKAQGYYEEFKKYSLNDGDFLFRYFIKECLPIIENRVKACEAIKMFNPEFEITERMIHSENNTNLLINAFSLEDIEEVKEEVKEESELRLSELNHTKMLYELDMLTESSNGTYETEFISGELIPHGDDDFVKSFNEIIEKYEDLKEPVKFKRGIDFNKAMDYKSKSIDFEEYIKPTGFEQFDRLVKFVNDNLFTKKDKKLKEDYCEFYATEYIKDDEQREHEGQIEIIVDSVDTFNLFGTLTTCGLGGIHGAINNYIGENLWHLDYKAFYSSIILKFIEYYKKIINVALYESLYNFRNYDVKVGLKGIEEKLNNMYADIENSGNDIGIIADYQGELEELEEKKSRLESLADEGCKLLLNSAYGIINSEFNFSVAHKQLGRFICLYGQYRAIELCKRIKKHSPNSNIVNLNTDGVIIDNIDESTVRKICEEDREDDYVVLDAKKIDKVIQFDVNNYIKITNRKMKTKGNAFKTKIKQNFVRFEKLPCNIVNALSLINHDNKVEILPIFFHQKSKKKSTISLENEESSRNKVYYLTNKEKGKRAIKHIANPIILSWGGEIMYFTTNKEDADLREYMKFARITEEKILTFTFNEKDNMKYYPYVLQEDQDIENIKKKRSLRTALNRIVPGKICMIDNKKKPLAVDLKPVAKLSNYNMTDILKSNEVFGFSIVNDDQLIYISTNNEEDKKLLDSYKTFEITHTSGHKCYIFNKTSEFINTDDFKNIKILNNEYISIVTLDGEFNCNVQSIKNYEMEKLKANG